MHILEIRSGLSTMIKSRLCLECGSCMRACLQNAISISKGDTAETDAGQAEVAADAPVLFTHVLDAVMAIAAEELRPRQIFSYNGMDLSDLNALETDDAQGFARGYTADKLLKMYHFPVKQMTCLKELPRSGRQLYGRGKKTKSF